MKKAKDMVVCVVDHGMFAEFALRLARQFKKVYYCNVWQRAFPRINELSIGDGFDEIERVDEVWHVKDRCDLFAFPDLLHSGVQRELAAQGKAVWGSRGADRLETDRQFFLRTLDKLGLEVAPHQVCRGLEQLRTYLFDRRNQYIKVSRCRGSTETRHWEDRKLSSGLLDELAVTFGPLQNEIPFIVFDHIEAVTEWGYDGYFCGGKFPRYSIQGPEIKDRCYIGCDTAWDDLPVAVREINEAMAPVLARANYTNFWHTEIRITEDGKAYFIDPTCRQASPAGEAILETYANLPEIVAAGAQGECLDGENEEEIVVECILNHHEEETRWRLIEIPDTVRRWFKLYNPVKIAREIYAVPPLDSSCDSIGAVLGIGPTIEQAKAHLETNLEAVSGQPVSAFVESLSDAVRQLQQAADEGIEMQTEIPSPKDLVTK